jgi:excinuclease ABC A subunit
MDEPSVGLHPRDINNLIKLLYRLRDQGNTVLVVEHDTSIIKAADWVVDIGPRAGTNGGNVLFSGETHKLLSEPSFTAQALLQNEKKVRSVVRRNWKDTFTVVNANKNNLRDVTVAIPMKVLSCITGVAGSGKSSLVEAFVEQYKERGEGQITLIDQKPVGKSSRSNPATYVGIFDSIRKIFAEVNGVVPSLFSFNSTGACSTCKGHGFVEMELSFINDVKIECNECHGKRYKKDVLALQYKGKSIHEILSMTIEEGIKFFSVLNTNHNTKLKRIVSGLQLLQNVGVGYLQLGQSLSTLSGGEAQRLKIASELKKKGNVYIMDEPTTGLHPSDVQNLLRIINELVGVGNTVLVIEHNLDVVFASDWVIDVGPEGGKNGGTIVAQGAPEAIVREEDSITGKYLAAYFDLSLENV